MLPRLSFSDNALERQYHAGQKAKLIRTEAGLYVTQACLWLLGALWLYLGRGVKFVCTRRGLLGGVAWLVTWLLSQHWPQHYAKYRIWWVVAIRLGITFQATLTFCLNNLPPQQQLRPTTAGLFSVVALGALLPDMWSIALGLRLGMGSHLALHTLHSALLATGGASEFCRSKYIHNPETLQRFWAISHHLTEWVGLLLPWPSQLKADEPAVYHCVALTVTVNVLLGFFLSTVTVYVIERRSRAEFLWREVAARGLVLSQAAEQLGLPAQEVVEVCLFDPLTEWLRWAMLLPPLIAATWLASSTLALRSVSDQPGGCGG